MSRKFAFALVVFALFGAPHAGLSELLSFEARQSLDLSAYRVMRPNAGIVDVARRRLELRHAHSPQFVLARRALPLLACADIRELPLFDFRLAMPAFYEQPMAWRQAIKPIFAFEDAITHLAATSLLQDGDYAARCIVDVLEKWAQAQALTSFHYSSKDRQAWYNTEDMLFAIGQAYALVRGRIPELATAEAKIDTWLAKASRNHISIAGGPDSCCNNHFYRRALHAAIIGVTVGAHDLFRFGVSALLSALHEMQPDGGFPRELSRPSRAIHYQNYALLYLVPIAEIVAAQGYYPYGWEVEGRTLATAVDFTVRLMGDPQSIETIDPLAQNLDFLSDRQYFAWAEIWLSRFDNSSLEARVAALRPIVNRSAVGHATLLFYRF